MSNSQNEKNEQQNNLCTTLTEQWKKGELESGVYYIKYRGAYEIDHWHGWYWEDSWSEYVEEVVALVPSYEEWQELKEDYKHAIYERDGFEGIIDICGKDNDELDKENEQLKDVISKMCMELVDPDDDMSSVLAEYFNQDLLLEIHEVLK